MKIVHIHSDVKFINQTAYFSNDKFFENFVVYIGNKEKLNYNNIHGFNIKIFGNEKSELNKIIDICTDATVIVVYGLDFSKSYIVNRLPATIPVFWQFFGYELYGKLPNYIYSKSTLNFYKRNTVDKIKYIFKPFVNAKQYLNWGKLYAEEINESIERVNYIICFAKLEYDFLCTFFNNLPGFIQRPFLYNASVERVSKAIVSQKKNQVIIGNSRHLFNNHLDIIEQIEQSGVNENYSFLFFFNYGPRNNYTQIVKNRGSQIKNTHFVETFLNKEDFNEIYLHSKAFVMNGMRQMAMGNIFAAFRNGVKVYLNPKNIIYKWLIEEGFIIFDIDKLSDDLRFELLDMDHNQIINNIKIYNELKIRYPIRDFQNIVLDNLNETL